MIDTNLDMANTFNEFFTNIGHILDNKIPKSQRPDGSKIYLPQRNPHSFLTSLTYARTYNNMYPATPGPLTHTPLFHKLQVLAIFDIIEVQLGKLIYESVNNIGPTNKVYGHDQEDVPKTPFLTDFFQTYTRINGLQFR